MEHEKVIYAVNVTNTVTVTLMVLTGLAAIGFISTLIRGQHENKPQQNDD